MERPNRAILNQAVTTGALPSPHRARPPAQRVSSPTPFLPIRRERAAMLETSCVTVTKLSRKLQETVSGCV